MRILLVTTVAWLVTPLLSAGQEPSREGAEFFERKIRPLLSENCIKCHAGPKLKGHFSLESRAGLIKGGDSGPAIVPGEPGKSLLVKAIGYAEPELRMPPRGKLTDEQIRDITTWIARGAPWPGSDGAQSATVKEFNLKERSGHWSLLPLKNQAPPKVENSAWVKSPIDAFILATLKEKGLAPAAPADRHTLLRRVSFDLIGLPPKPEEISAFIGDSSPDAFAKVVDRLLASPRYGERWARHWLDLVRYAETLGHEFDIELPEAWRYRDYVIRAFNDDIPFAQFVTEHIAGDLLAEPRRRPVGKTNESILGTGFWFLGEAKHSPVDARGDQADRIDNQIDVFGKTFLGMTLACARCHDHRFDAISTKDYYALAGFLQSSRQQRAFIDEPAPRREKLLRLGAIQEKVSKRAAENLLASLKAGKEFPEAPLRDFLASPIRRTALLSRPDGSGEPSYDKAGPIVYADARRQGFRDWLPVGEAFDEIAPSPTVAVDATGGVGAVRVQPSHRGRSDTLHASLAGALRSPTFVIPKRRIHFRATGKDVRINVVVDGLQLIRDPIYGGLTFVVNTQPKAAAGSTPHAWHTMDVSMWVGHRAYIEVLDDGPGAVNLERVIFSDAAPPPEAPNGLLSQLVSDAKNDSREKLALAYQTLVSAILDQWATGVLHVQPDSWERIDLLNAVLAASAREGPEDRPVKDAPLRELEKEAAMLAMSLPAPTRALAMTDGSAVDENVFIRGNHRNAGEIVPRRFLEVFGGKPTEGKGSGRLELARHVTDPARTPIVPRVIVNRLWKHHFGEGLVRTPDDFGVLGQAPTHPELLDYLATEFVKNGWSIKKMHRQMLLSSAYQMDSHAPVNDADPDNKLLYKMPVRRLEAEAIRDAVLAISGGLDRTMFGPGVPPHLTPFMAGRGRPNTSGPLDGNGRRSIYLEVRRNFLNPLFLAFDYPTPFSTMGKRGVSNVPAQSLTMMNNPFIVQQANLWGQALAGDNTDASERLRKMYLAALGRPPHMTEVAEALGYLEEQTRVHGRPDDPRAWADLAHVLFNIKEFVFVQ